MNLKFRQAAREDLPEIVRMLADDFLGAQRERFETPLPESYERAFAEIEADKNNELIVAVMADLGFGNADFGSEETENPKSGIPNPKSEVVVGTLQITFTPSISFQGGKRATVESVRVDAKYRGRGIGRELMKWAIERARAENCVSMQLTTNMDRTDAHRFYENLGFKKSHLGMKLPLKN